MSQRAGGEVDREQRIAEALGGYLEAVEAGRATTRAELLARHPEIGAELAAFLAEEERLAVLVEPLRAAAEAVRADEPAAADTEATLPRVPFDPAQPGDKTSPDPGKTTAAIPPPDGGMPNNGGDSDQPLPRGDRVRYFGDYEVL